MLGRSATAPTLSRDAVCATAGGFAGIPLRLALSFVLALAIVLSAFAGSSPAHAALDGLPVDVSVAASAPDVVGGLTAIQTDDPANPHDLGLGKTCTGHCGSHVFSVPLPASLGLYFHVEPMVWDLAQPEGLPAWRPSSLDRPPRG